MRWAWSLPALLAGLSGCGDLPQPFAGNPGANALRLAAAAPPPRLDIPVPTAALLPPPQAAFWTRALADELLRKEVPAMAQPVRSGDWHLAVSAARQGDQVVPTYRIIGPSGRVVAQRQGEATPAASWSGADPALLAGSAALAATEVDAMLTGIQAAEAQADPHSLLNRPTVIYFAGVTGAPGNGDEELGRDLAVRLPDEHDELKPAAAGADYVVVGTVSVSPPDRAQNGVQHVEIVWTVHNARGHEAGRATQLHDVPAHSLDGYWGDVAVAAADEAAGGIHEVISNNEGRTHAGAPAGPQAGPQATAGGS